MRERVFVRRGSFPVLLVAPHGSDDNLTVTLTERAACLLNCHAVINQGFDRSSSVDVINDKADCNRIDHVKQDVVYEEFLQPIIKIQAAHKRSIYLGIDSRPLLILHIHGAGNSVHAEANEQVSCIVGYGLGINKHSVTCQSWRIDAFIDFMRLTMKGYGEVYTGKGGGKYAGRDSNNLNQYFRKHQLDPFADSLQLEFPFSMRKSEDVARKTAEQLASVLFSINKFSNYITNNPQTKFI